MNLPVQIAFEKTGVDKITEICFSDLPPTLKCNSICRILCHHVGAASVSLIFYDGFNDALLTKGNYFDPEKFSVTDSFYGILKNIHFYEFMAYHNHSHSLKDTHTAYADYINSSVTNLVVNSEEFMNIKDFSTLLKSHNEEAEKYALYSEAILNHKYSIYNSEKDSISGKYYRNLIERINTGSEPYIISYNDIKVEKKCLDGLTKLGVLKNTEFGQFVGLPLIANNRYFGIVRILFQSDMDFNRKRSRLMAYARTLSLYYGNTYQVDELNELNIHEHIVRKDIEFDELCEAYRKILNCYGCIIRLFDQEISENEIVGKSKNVRGYVEKIKDIDPYKYTEGKKRDFVLKKIFENENGDTKINAIKISPFEKEVTYYYYLPDTEVLKETCNWNELEKSPAPEVSKLFLDVHLALLNENKINEIIIVPIPNVEHSIISFANTHSHFFTKKDLDFVLPLIHRLGLELSYENNKTQENLIRSYILYGRRLHHELGIPLRYFEAILKTMLEKDPYNNDFNALKYNYEYVRYMLMQSDTSTNYLYLLNYKDEMSDSEIEKFQNKFKKLDNQVYDLLELVDNFIQVFRYKSNLVGVYINRDCQVNNVMTRYNKTLIMSIMVNLLDNAIKYSFGRNHLKRFVENYNESKIESEGNIRCEIKVGVSEMIINVVNWGAPPSLGRDIYKMGNRGTTDIKSGNGMGLFFVKSFVEDVFDGSIDHSHKNHKTTFSVRLKHTV